MHHFVGGTSMKKRWINKNLVISILFFVVFLAVVVVTELDLIADFDSVDIVVAAEKIPKDHIIEPKDLVVQKYPRELFRKGMITNPNDIVGKRTVQMIEASAFLTKNYVDESFLRPTKEHEFFPIPNEWMAKLQGTIRRYDLVNITAVYVGKNIPGSDNLSPTWDIKKDFVFKKVPVVYVKNSKNQEVSGVQRSNDRLNGNANPADVELSLTLEQFKELEKLYLEGYRFVLSYK